MPFKRSKIAHALKFLVNCRVSSFHMSCSNKAVVVEGGKEVIEGQTISYVRTGQGPHALLCLPGALGSAWTDFKPQLEQLDKTKFTIVAWDPPGYGFSRPPDRDFSHAFFHKDADMAWKLMKMLKFSRFSMLGWSDGGITAMIIAAKYPNYIQKCIVWGANAYVTPEEAEIYEKMRDVNSWSEKMKTQMISLYGEEYFKKMWNEWVDAFVNFLKFNGGDICEKEVKRISCPVLILHGAKDPMIASEHPKYLANHIYSSRLHVFPTGKHNIHLRYPDEFNKIVSDFLLNYAPVGAYASKKESSM